MLLREQMIIRILFFIARMITEGDLKEELKHLANGINLNADKLRET